MVRSLLPELPEQKTIEELAERVFDAWVAATGDEWGGDDGSDISLEEWLKDLHDQLDGLVDAKPTHPEFLKTKADYTNAPAGTVVVGDGFATTWVKRSDTWASTDGETCFNLSYGTRRVLRWGWNK